jgi:hypothetical protein
MPIGEKSITEQLAEILDNLRLMDRRISTIESEIGIRSAYTEEDEGNIVKDLSKKKSGGHGFESSFGEYGLAWIGNIVLLFGITFLMKYIQSNGHNLMSILFGYVIVASIFMLSQYLKKAYSILSRTFKFTALALMYYVTLGLHFFQDEPLISNKSSALILLLLVVIFQLFYAARRKSAIIAGMALIMTIFTALVSDSTHILLPTLTLVAAISVTFYFRFGWWKLLMFSIFLVYTGFALWFMGNPIMGHSMGFITTHQFGFLYLFGIGAIYSFLAIDNKKIELDEIIAVLGVLFNGLLFSLMLALFVTSFFKTDYILLFLLIAIYCLIFSIMLKSRSIWKFAPAFYALYGFLALSIAVYGIYGLPRAYWLLSLQSLLVVSMALWFRNKIIVLMNTMLFVIIFCIYLGSSEPINEVNYSFALVALATARILNWKKDRLEIKTEMLRNVYLLSSFVMVLYALYHSLPVNLITLSWTIITICYFVLSVLLKNVKYRYMALGTMVAAALHLFLVDLARIEIVYRVIAFLFLAIISIFISVFYTRRVKKANKEIAAE